MMKELSLKKESHSYTEAEFLAALKIVYAKAKTLEQGTVIVDRLSVFFGLDPTIARVDPTKLLEPKTDS